MTTQHEKIKEMCRDGKWHCQVEYWDLFIRSPHKRRGEIAEEGEFYFIDRPCEHNHRLVKDYLMIKNENWIDPKPPKREIREVYNSFGQLIGIVENKFL